MVGSTDELFILILANYYVPSDDLTKRMVELGVCFTNVCAYDPTRQVVHANLPIFYKIEAMIVAGCQTIFQTYGDNVGSGSPSGTSYPVRATSYTAVADDVTSFVVAVTIGKRVISVVRSISPLTDNQWTHDDSTGEFNLVNGAPGLSDGESVLIFYEDIP